MKFNPKSLELAWQQYFAWCDENPWITYEQNKKGGSLVQIPVSRPYTEAGFCAFHDLGINYIKQLWENVSKQDDEESKEFSSVITRARAKCFSQKFEGAAIGVFNSNIIARDLGLVDKTENKTEINGNIKTETKADLSKLTTEELIALDELQKKVGLADGEQSTDGKQ